MARFSIIAALLLVAAVTFKSKYSSDSEEKKPLKINGFSISKPKAHSPVESKRPSASRRSVSKLPINSVAKTPLVEGMPQAEIARKVPIQALSPEQKIDRAKQAWENIRIKALDRLRVDESTRERLAELREDYYKTPSSMRYSDYERSLKDLLGEESFAFLYNAREEFKARIYDRAQIEIGPHLGEL